MRATPEVVLDQFLNPDTHRAWNPSVAVVDSVRDLRYLDPKFEDIEQVFVPDRVEGNTITGRYFQWPLTGYAVTVEIDIIPSEVKGWSRIVVKGDA